MRTGEKEQTRETLHGGDGDHAGVPAGISDTGCERELNEDRYAVVESPSGLAWVVCDGMGGTQGGELAAQLVIDSVRRDLEKFPKRSLETALKGAIQEANRTIILRRQNPAFAQMGTTIVAAMFQGQEVMIAHVGDSRAYLIRDGVIQQLTTDHTYVQDLVSKGQIRPEDALTHPDAHILTKAIGSEPALDIDTLKLWLWEAEEEKPKDHLLLCSDGLYSLVSDLEMAEMVSTSTPNSACARLVELARSRGGFDNITVAIVPLNGQLHVEPPAGFAQSQARAREAEKKRNRKKKREPVSMAKIAVGVAVTSVLAFFLAVFGFAWTLSSQL